MVAEIIGVGAALTDPDLLQQNVRLLAEELNACDLEIRNRSSVGTNVQRLRGAIAKALERSDIVFLLGGMGATNDDITKQTVCEGLGRKLVMHEDSLRRIKAAYDRAKRQMPRPISRLAMMPEQSVVFPGVRGLTPGCALSAGQQFIIMLPEAPKEFVPIVQNSVVPYLAKFSSAALNTRVINVFGRTENEVKAAVGKYALLRNPTVAVQPKNGEVHIVITTRAKSKTEAASLSAPVIKALLAILGDSVYGVDQPNLQSVVIGALRANRVTMSVAEAGTSGRLTELLTHVDPQERAFLFGVTANSQKNKQDALKIPDKFLKKFDPVSEQTAAAMAYGALMRGQSTLGIGVTGSAGLRGEDAKKTGVYFVAVCNKDDVWVKKLMLPKGAGADYIQYMACMTALDLARRIVAALPQRYGHANSVQNALAGKVPDLISQHADVTAGGGKVPKKGPWFAAVLPYKGDDAKEVVRKMILIVAILVFLGSAGYIGNFFLQSHKNKKLTEEIAQMYVAGMDEESIENIEVPSDYPKGYQKKFANLYGINKDIAGWIKIEDTQINYPVVQTANNTDYDRTDFYKKANRHGTPWLDYNDSLDPQSDQYVIYGHNMTDGQMFGELMKYKPSGMGIEYLKSHSMISMDDVYRNNDYKIVSVFITNAKEQYGEVFYYNSHLDFKDEAEFNTFVQEFKDRSYYNSDIDIKYGDQFLTLSTCSYEYGPVSDDAHVRTVVIGRRLRDGENLDNASYSYNANPKMPPGFTKEASNLAKQQAAAAEAAAKSSAQASEEAQAAASANTSTELEVTASKNHSSTQWEDEDDWDKSSSRRRRSSSEEEAESSSRKSSSSRRSSSEAVSSEIVRSSSAAVSSSSQAAAVSSSSQTAASTSSEAVTPSSSSEPPPLPPSSSSEPTPPPSPSSEPAPPPSSEEATPPPSTEETPSSKQEETTPANDGGTASTGGDTATVSVNADGYTTNVSTLAAKTSKKSSDKLTIVSNGKKVSGTAATIVPKVVMNEMGDSFSQEALKAQAVACYTFIKQQNASGVTPYFGTKTPSSNVKKACQSVLGEAVYYKNKLAFTPFYAMSAGVTNSSREVWGGSYDYLVSVDSDVDKEAKNFEVSVTYSADTVAEKVEKALDIDLYDYSSDPRKWFEIESYTDGGGYVKEFRVGDETITGRTFREKVMGLRSAAFEFEYDRRSEKFTFTTFGYGHGVGLSQMGANFLAEEGWTYDEILTHYYPGTRVK